MDLKSRLKLKKYYKNMSGVIYAGRNCWNLDWKTNKKKQILFEVLF